jgi:DNA-binding CsgD family transcriptional regulator
MLNPNGPSAGAPAEDVPQFDALPEMARRFRRICEAVGGDAFTLLLVSPMAESRRLVPCIDSDYPGVSVATKLLVATLAERFVRRMTSTTQPCWWAADEDSRTATSLSRCLWAERIPEPEELGTALALPLLDERGNQGVMVIRGSGIAVGMAELADAQARSMAIFAMVARLQPSPTRGARAMSKRELECLKLTANGQTSEEIAARLGLSVHTANQYLTNTTQKLNAVNRIHAVAKALRLGLID